MEPTTTSVDVRELNERIHQQSAFIELLQMELNKALVGQKHMVERLLIGLLANGHVLLEGVPGLAKHWPSNRWHLLYTHVLHAYSLRLICCLQTY
jgi:hypothetical protein